MKKIYALMLAFYLFVCPIWNSGSMENEGLPIYIYIQYAVYDGFSLEGRAEIGEGTYFARATFFLPNDQCFVLIIPISREGLFLADIACNCVSAVVWIVDSPCALVSSQGVFYAGKEVALLPP